MHLRGIEKRHADAIKAEGKRVGMKPSEFVLWLWFDYQEQYFATRKEEIASDSKENGLLGKYSESEELALPEDEPPEYSFADLEAMSREEFMRKKNEAMKKTTTAKKNRKARRKKK